MTVYIKRASVAEAQANDAPYNYTKTSKPFEDETEAEEVAWNLASLHEGVYVYAIFDENGVMQNEFES